MEKEDINRICNQGKITKCPKCGKPAEYMGSMGIVCSENQSCENYVWDGAEPSAPRPAQVAQPEEASVSKAEK